MTVAQYITKLRQFASDIPVLTRDRWDGDGTVTAFRTKQSPITGTTYTVKVGGVSKVETTDYTLDKDSGLLTFVSAPGAGNDNVTFAYYYAVLSDTEWMEVINNIIREWREKMWEDEIDETTLNTVAYQDDYSLASVSANIWKVIGVWFRTSSADSSYWIDAARDSNVKYLAEQNSLNFRPPFDISGYDMRIRYLRSFAEISAVTDTFTVPEKYHAAMTPACVAEFLDRLMMKHVRESGAKIKEEGYKTMETMLRLKESYIKTAEKRLARIRPSVPATTINNIHFGLKG